jgi:hypothetical protein
MPALQNVVLKDRKSTPVDHTFTPKDVVQGVGTVIESTGVPIGNSKLSVSARQSAGPNGRYKATLKLAVPVVVTETINGVANPKVVRTAYANVDFTFDPTSSEAERNDLVGMLEYALKSDRKLVNDAIVKLEGVYGS